jgi:hypothetical protein
MISTVDDLHTVLGVDFALARAALHEARLRHALKDSPSNRAAVAEAGARIDALLDMYVDAGGTAR